MRRAGTLMAVLAAIIVMASAPAFAAPGNNGTVKIDGVEFDTHPNNEPHVGCVFQVDFYGYDEGDLEASASFSLHPPTGTDHLLTETTPIGGDPAGGGTDLDAELTIDLTEELAASGATPHAIQGFHVKLTVNAEGSIGADVKHKVFWVKCDQYPPVETQVAAVGGSGTDRSFSDGGSSGVPWVAGALLLLSGATVLVVRRSRTS